MEKTNPATMRLSAIRRRASASIVAVAIMVSCALPIAGLASPGVPMVDARHATSQNVDYIGAESGAALDLGFPVLVPSWVPGPFGGTPSIDAGGGYYSLYWMNGGGEPTFLQVTGQVGGGLPAGSPYDLNVQLFINADVQGYGAIHDVTPAYDAVWWVAGGVLYKVESRNSSTDSLTLANSLITFVPPSAPEPEPTEPPVVDEIPEPEVPADEPDSDSGGATTLPEESESDTSGEAVAENPGDESDNEPATDDGGSSTSPTVVPVGSDGTGVSSVNSDGTGGAPNLVIGGDGTGGTHDVVVPRRPGVSIP